MASAGQPRLQVKISADASEAVDAFREAATGLKGMGAASEDVARQSEAVAAALTKVGNATDSPGKLASATQQAAIKVKDLKEALEAAEAAGETMPAGLVGALEKAEAALTGSKARLAQFKTALDDVGDAGKEAGTKVAAGIAKAEPAMTEVQAAAKKLEVELEALGKADTARGLAQGSARAKVALDELEAAAKTAGVSVDKFGVNIKDAETKINAAAGKAGALRDAMGDMTTRGNLAAQGMEAVASRAGSLDGLLGGLKDTAGATAGKIADVGFAATGVVGAFMFGYEAANKFMDSVKAMGGPDIRNTGAAIVSLTDGVLKLGERFNDIPARVNPALKALQAHGRMAAEADEALKGLVTGWKTTGEIASDAKKVDDSLANLSKIIGETDRQHKNWNTSVLENKESILKLWKEAEAHGKTLESLDPKLRTAILLAQGMTAAEEKSAAARKAMRESTEGAIPSIQAITAALQKDLQQAREHATSVVEMAEREKVAREKASAALEAYAKANGLTDKEVAQLLKNQEAVNAALLAGAPAADRYSDALNKVGRAAQKAGEEEEKAQRRLTQKISETYDKAKQSVSEYGAALDKTADSSQSAARQELAKETATARAGMAAAATVEEYNKHTEALEAVKQKSTLLTIAEDKLALAIGEAGRANETFNMFLPTSTEGLRDFAAAVEGPITSLQKLTQQFTYLSDQTSGWMAVWVEPLITDLEKGKIGIEKFRQALDDMTATSQVLAAWSMGTVTEYQNMLRAMSVAEQEYFDHMRAMQVQAVADAQKTAIALRDAKYIADKTAPGSGGGMGGGAGGSMGSGSGGAAGPYGGGMSGGGGTGVSRHLPEGWTTDGSTLIAPDGRRWFPGSSGLAEELARWKP